MQIEDNKETEEMEIDQPKNSSKRKNRKTVIEEIKKEDTFVKNILKLIHVPKHKKNNYEDEVEDVSEEKKRSLLQGVKRVENIHELQKRLSDKMSQLRGGDNKPKGLPGKKSKKERLKEKKAQVLLNKKKEMRNNLKVSLENKSAGEKKKPPASAKPLYNSEGKMVFSKFDFREENENTEDKGRKLDPKAALRKLETHKKKIKDLQAIGKTERVKDLNEKGTWKTAIDKSSGTKVKDNEALLKKSIKKMEARKKSSKKKWENRKDGVENRQATKQKKRQENISQHKQDKKQKKLKKINKKGKLVPGFR